MNLRRVDLNLLVVFEAMIGHRGVSRAAAALGLSQPALSEAVGRLRHMFEDELFVRRGADMMPTQRAQALAVPIASALAEIRAALDPGPRFDPASSRRTFRIGTSDYAEAVILPPLLERLSSEAPDIDLRSIATTPTTALARIDDGDIEFAIDVFPRDLPKRYRRHRLLDEHALCLARRGHPATAGGLTLGVYTQVPHVLRASDGSHGRGVVDRALRRAGRRRRVALTIANALALPYVLTRSDFIATQPARIARQFAAAGALELHAPPIEIERWSVDLVARLRPRATAESSWLEALVAAVCATID